ncbi:winged helix-turn-helix transcriptional regulator [Candidatus Woesearchaeota archaeon]|nr:winged helix-turn-helix transcriptional regulator [Candidatus Woesearchaeota archaeon]
MDNKKLGIIFLVISIVLIIILVQLMSGLNTKAKELGCFENSGCIKIESSFSITHFAFGFIGFILALGFYLIFFSKDEKAFVEAIEKSKNKELEGDKFELISKGLDEYEKMVLKAVKDQDGITQNTLRLRTNMSKAKLSYVLRDLEKKEFIIKDKKGKTNAIFLKKNI